MSNTLEQSLRRGDELMAAAHQRTIAERGELERQVIDLRHVLELTQIALDNHIRTRGCGDDLFGVCDRISRTLERKS